MIQIPGALVGYMLVISSGAILCTILSATYSPTMWWQGMIAGALLGLIEYALTPDKPRITVEFDGFAPLRRAEHVQRTVKSLQAWLKRLWH